MKVILALHGFLGIPQDFLRLANLVAEKQKDYVLVPVDYMNIRGLTPEVPLERWGENFNLWVAKNYSRASHKIILGYSQGGRLALQAVKQNPKSWGASIFLSTNPGLRGSEERVKRRDSDQRWAQRFQSVDFSTVVREWNSQAVFLNSKNEPQRLAKDYDSRILSKALTQWSLANQIDFRLEPAVFEIPNLWIAGELDEKYVQIVHELEQQGRNLSSAIIEGASHRLFVDAPEAVCAVLNQFINSLRA